MNHSALTEKIQEFWDWFGHKQALIEEVVSGDNHPKTHTLIEEFDHHILGIGRFKWILDNPRPNEFTLTLSPNKNVELYQITRSIIADAPPSSNWSFFDHIQPTGTSHFEIYDAQMDPQTIDPKSWLIVLTKLKNERFDLHIYPRNTEHLDLETREVAAEIAIMNLVGEDQRMLKINKITLCASENELDTKSIIAFSDLKLID